FSIRYWEMNSASGGIIWMISTTTTKDIRPRKRKREIATAATKAQSTAMKTQISVTDRLSRSEAQNWSSNARAKASRVKFVGRNDGVGDRSASAGCSAPLRIQ